MRVLILEDDPTLATCYRLNLSTIDPNLEITTCSDAVVAMQELSTTLPDLILLDVLLPGPDGFTFLNELVSYSDTATIPIIIISSLDFRHQDLSHYGVKAIFAKDTLMPAALRRAVTKLLYPQSAANHGATHA